MAQYTTAGAIDEMVSGGIPREVAAGAVASAIIRGDGIAWHMDGCGVHIRYSVHFSLLTGKDRPFSVRPLGLRYTG